MITHIIVNDPWSLFSDFFFPGCAGTFKDPTTNKRLRSTDAKLDLAEVPFVHLRYLFKRELEKSPGSYLQLIQQLRARAINLEHELSIRVDTNLSRSLSMIRQSGSARTNFFFTFALPNSRRVERNRSTR